MESTPEIEVSDDEFGYLIQALEKPYASRSHDDLLLLKSYVSKTELITKDLDGIVNPRQTNDICRSLGLEVFDEGEVIFHQGDVAELVYVVLRGKVDVRVRYKIDLMHGQSEIREKLIKTYSTGQFFGERALQFDEPRSASVTALETTYLITLHKSIYMQILNEAKKDTSLNLKSEQFGTKEGVIKILSKVRQKRTPQELDGVAGYIHRRIPFFQKFSMQQLVELCRVAETLTIWGRSILFKQGEIGQAFYVILSGSVEVWAKNEDSHSVSSTGSTKQQQHSSSSSSTSKPMLTKQATSSAHQLQGGVPKKAQDLTEGLGIKVNQLVVGDVFGERALENESSQRMASIITGDDTTDLLVIAKEDYHSLVYVMMHNDSMHKLQLLRRTQLFHSLEVVHLRALARFMELKKFQINEELITAGKRVSELMIIERGECRVVTEITEGFESKEASSNPHFLQSTHHNVLKLQSPNDLANDDRDEVLAETPSISPFTTEHNHLLHKERKPKQKLLGNGTLSPPKPSADILEISKRSFILATRSSMSLEVNPQAEQEEPQIAADWSAALMEKKAQKRGQLTRYASSQLIPIGARRKKIDLGRLAPDSVIAPNMVLAEGVHGDTFHLETVVAASLVECYVINKSDFFNHVPKDTKNAIQKIVKEYKAPLLSPLWENSARVMDDTQWRIEKAWERFRSDFVHGDNPQGNILNNLKALSRLHLSMTSGNDPSRVGGHMISNENVVSTPKTEVTMEWGLPSGNASLRNDDESISKESITSSPIVPNSLIAMSQSTAAALQSNALRQRLNQAHAREQSLLQCNNVGSLDPLATAAAMRSNLKLQPDTLSRSTSLQATTSSTPLDKTEKSATLIEQPFALIQIHREYARADPASAAAQSTRRVVRSYLRLCGVFPSIAKAKELADLQLEQLFLSLYQSDLSKQQELLLHWNTFKGFESIPTDDSDHFLIYCRSSPMECASIAPSRNIFHAPFPAICKPSSQRYAVVVMNQILSDESPWNQGNGSKRKPQRAVVVGSRVRSSKKEVTLGSNVRGSAPEEDDVFDTNHPAESDDEDPEQQIELQSKSLSRNNSTNKPKFKAQQSQANIKRLASMDEDSVSSSSNGNVGPSNPLTRNGSMKLFRRSSSGLFDSAPSATFTGTPAALGQSESQVTLPPFIGGKKSTWPLYLQELSSVYESLVVSFTRLEGLRYAVKRFGAIPNDNLSFTNKRPMTESSSSLALSTSADASTSIQLKSLFNTDTGFSATTGSGKTGDRVLRIVHQEQKKICIIPLFRWILLNADTLDTLNFISAFKESNVRKILLAEEFDQNPFHDLPSNEDEHEEYELDADGNLVVRNVPNATTASSSTSLHAAMQPHIAPGEYRDVLTDLQQKNLPNDLIKSFSEAGFIPRQLHSDMGSQQDLAHVQQSNGAFSSTTGETNVDIGDDDGPLRSMTDKLKAIKILEREVESKEMSNQIRSLTHLQSKTLFGSSSSPAFSHSRPGTQQEDRPDADEYRSVSSATPHSASRTQRNAKPSASNVELRLKLLSNAATEASKILKAHDQLCTREHGADDETDVDSDIYSQNVYKGQVKLTRKKVPVKHFTRDESELMRQRLRVIETLQKMHIAGPSHKSAGSASASASSAIAAGNTFNNSTSTTFPTESEKISPSQPTSMSALVGLQRTSTGQNGTPQTAAGKRLAESLRVLSDSLDSQLQHSFQ